MSPDHPWPGPTTLASRLGRRRGVAHSRRWSDSRRARAHCPPRRRSKRRPSVLRRTPDEVRSVRSGCRPRRRRTPARCRPRFVPPSLRLPCPGPEVAFEFSTSTTRGLLREVGTSQRHESARLSSRAVTRASARLRTRGRGRADVLRAQTRDPQERHLYRSPDVHDDAVGFDRHLDLGRGGQIRTPATRDRPPPAPRSGRAGPRSRPWPGSGPRRSRTRPASAAESATFCRSRRAVNRRAPSTASPVNARQITSARRERPRPGRTHTIGSS